MLDHYVQAGKQLPNPFEPLSLHHVLQKRSVFTAAQQELQTRWNIPPFPCLNDSLCEKVINQDGDGS